MSEKAKPGTNCHETIKALANSTVDKEINNSFSEVRFIMISFATIVLSLIAGDRIGTLYHLIQKHRASTEFIKVKMQQRLAEAKAKKHLNRKKESEATIKKIQEASKWVNSHNHIDNSGRWWYLVEKIGTIEDFKPDIGTHGDLDSRIRSASTIISDTQEKIKDILDIAAICHTYEVSLYGPEAHSLAFDCYTESGGAINDILYDNPFKKQMRDQRKAIKAVRRQSRSSKKK